MSLLRLPLPRLLLASLLAWACLGASFAGTESESYVRTGLFVFEPDETSVGTNAISIRTYSPDISLGKGKTLRFFADSNVPSVFLVAALDRETGGLHAKLAPLLSELKEDFSEIEFPVKRGALTFDRSLHVDLYLAVISSEDADLGKLRTLVAAIETTIKMPESDDSKAVLQLQAIALKKLINGWARETRHNDFAVRYPPPATAGLQRNSTIRWREQCQKFDRDPESRFVRLFRISANES